MQRIASYFLPAFTNLRSQRPGYTLLGRLDGHSGSVNCISFTHDGMQLASGSDDESVRIWDIDLLVGLQVIRASDQTWGQITCLTWLPGIAEQEGNALCFGTGRGHLALFRHNRNSSEMVEAAIIRAFDWGDGMEAMVFDPTLRRLLVSSHCGKIRMYSIKTNDSFLFSWEVVLNQEIPRSLFFMDNSQDVVVFGLEKGTMVYHDAQTGAEKSTRSLKPGIGNAAACHKGRQLVIDNLTEGFDIYTTSRMTSVVRRLRVPQQRRGYFIRGVAFGEAAQAIMCGSDHGTIYVFAAKPSDEMQTLVHAEGRLVQAIDTVSLPRKHLIASSISEGRFDICIWVKPVCNRRIFLLNERLITSGGRKLKPPFWTL
ncbi:hypothetical protein APHAL10511_002808 [Amanita phalloides]|nr:hypothetical protein APHAL10511_002808 [Amanita phalloides]